MEGKYSPTHASNAKNAAISVAGLVPNAAAQPRLVAAAASIPAIELGFEFVLGLGIRFWVQSEHSRCDMKCMNTTASF